MAARILQKKSASSKRRRRLQATTKLATSPSTLCAPLATRCWVYLGLVVEIDDDRQPYKDNFTLPLLPLTWLIAVLPQFLSLQVWAADLATLFQLRIQNLIARFDLVLAMAGIGWRSVTWGLGLG